MDNDNTTTENKETKKMSSRKKATIISVSLLVVAILIIGAFLSVYLSNYVYPIITFTYRGINDLKEEYILDETNEYIANINYEDYLNEVSYSKKNEIIISEILNGDSLDPIKNTQVIEQAMNEFEENSCVIVFDKSLKVAPIELKDNVTVVILEDIILEGLTYDESVNLGIVFNIDNDGPAVLYAKDAKRISIIGPGTIECHGATYTNMAEDSSVLTPLEEFNVKNRVLEARKRIRTEKTSNRPNAIYFDNCQDVEVKNVRIHESANWTCKFVDSNNIKIKNLVIDNNLHVANADGIDLVGCQKVKIEHCFIATADDGICVKANSNETAKDIQVNRCTIISMANNFKIGTETSKDVINVDVMNCYFYMPENVVGGYSGIAIESVDGSNVKDVYVDNIYMSGVSAPVLIWLGNRLDKNKGSNGTMGSISDVSISNITAKNVEMASAVTGCKVDGKNYYVNNVKLANFNVEYRDTAENLNIGSVDDERSMNGYPEITRILHNYFMSHELSSYNDMPVSGLFCRHVSELTVIDFKVKARSCSTLPIDNVTNEKDRYDLNKVFVK